MTRFDKMLELLNKSIKTPDGVIDAAGFVHDTANLAHAAAQSIFETKRPTVEMTLGIYDRIRAEMLRAKSADK